MGDEFDTDIGSTDLSDSSDTSTFEAADASESSEIASSEILEDTSELSDNFTEDTGFELTEDSYTSETDANFESTDDLISEDSIDYDNEDIDMIEQDEIAEDSFGEESDVVSENQSEYVPEDVEMDDNTFESDQGEELQEDVLDDSNEDDPPKVLKRDEFDLLKTGNDAINQRLEAQADDYRDKGLSEEEIEERLAEDKQNYQKEFLEDAFPGQEVSPNVFNGFSEADEKELSQETNDDQSIDEQNDVDETQQGDSDFTDSVSVVAGDFDKRELTDNDIMSDDGIMTEEAEVEETEFSETDEVSEANIESDVSTIINNDNMTDENSYFENDDVDGEEQNEVAPDDNSIGSELSLEADDSNSPSSKMSDGSLFEDNKETDYVYTETDYGKHASGQLDLEKGKRSAYAQRTVGGEDRQEYDDGGHLIGSRFAGSGSYENLDAQSRDLNRGEYKKMENEWAKSLENGERVYVDVNTYKSNGSDRPDAFMGYSITEDGSGTRSIDAFSFQNESVETQEEWEAIVSNTDMQDDFGNPMEYTDEQKKIITEEKDTE